jgi:predicted peroxiredoxin
VDDQKIRIDVGCIRSGDEICAVAQPRSTEALANRPLVLDDGRTCMIAGDQLECARDYRIAKCLVQTEGLNISGALKVKSTDPEISKLKRHINTDRMALCGKAHPSAALIGDFVKLNQNAGLRMKIEGGVTIATAKKGELLQVIDVELPFDDLGNRLYKVRTSPITTGWISAGPTADGEKVVSVVKRSTSINSSAPAAKGLKFWLPTVGSSIEVAKADGLKLLVSTNGEVKTTLAKNEKAVVEEVKILGAANEIWLRVKTASDVGYIYSGSTYPNLTVDQWVKVK